MVLTHLPVFLINLDRSPDRLVRATADLQSLGLDPIRIAAVDGALLDLTNRTDYDEKPAIRALNRPLLVSEIGCYLSHIAAAQAFVASQAQFGLVFEDDFAPIPNSKVDLVALFDWLPTSGNWDLFNAGRDAKSLRRIIFQLPSGRKICRADYFPVTTSALLWSRQGAQKFLAQHDKMAMPVDVYLQTWCTANGSGLACSPALFGVTGAASLIGDSKTERRSGSKRRLNMAPQLRKLRNYLYAISAYFGVRRT